MSGIIPEWSLWIASTQKYKSPSLSRAELDAHVATWSRLSPARVFVGTDRDEWGRLELKYSPYCPAVFMHSFCDDPYDLAGHRAVSGWLADALSKRAEKTALLNFEGLWKPWGQEKPVTGHENFPGGYPNLDADALREAVGELRLPNIAAYYLWCALGSENDARCAMIFWMRHSLNKAIAPLVDILVHPTASGKTYNTANRRMLYRHGGTALERIINQSREYIMYPGGRLAGAAGWEHAFSNNAMAEMFWMKTDDVRVIYVPYDVLPSSEEIVTEIISHGDA